MLTLPNIDGITRPYTSQLKFIAIIKNLTLMKQLFIALIALFAISFQANAQEEKGKPNVLIDYFSRPSTVPFKYAETVRTSVMEGLHASNRVNLIDVDTKDVLKIEAERREAGVSPGDDMERLALMQQEGADLLIQGIINDITISETVTTDSKGEKSYSYEPIFAFTLKVLDPKTGKIVETQTFKIPNGLFDLSGFTIIAHSEDEAVTAYSKLIPKKLNKFINAAFPIVGSMLEIADSKGDEAKTLYISLGATNGANAKQKYDVREVRTIGGRESRKIIGEVEVTDVEGDDISLCKVKRGGKEISKSVGAGNKVIVTSKD